MSGVAFDLEDIDAAFEELDARYLAGEACRAPEQLVGYHAGMCGAEPTRNAATASDCVECRPSASLHRSRLATYRRTSVPGWRTSVKHVLHSRGRASAYRSRSGRHPHGEGNVARGLRRRVADDRCLHRRRGLDQPLSRCSTRQTSTPHSPGSMNYSRRRRGWKTRQAKVTEPYWKHFAAREWAAMAELLANDISTEDRRRVVNAGIRHGRDEHMADMRAIAEVVPDMDIATAVMATRGSASSSLVSAS